MLEEHQRGVDDRQDVVGVHRREVLYPAEPRRVAQFDGFDQHPVEGDEEGDLQQHRQAAAGRVHFFVFVEFHHRHAGGLAVVAVALFDALHFRAEAAHFRHGFVGPGGGGEEQQFDEQGGDDDGPAPVVDDAVDEVDDVEHRLADHEEEAVIDGFVKVRGDGFQVVLDFRADVDFAGEAGAGAGGDFARGADDTGVVVAAVVVVFAEESLRLALRRHDGAEEVVLDHRHPAGLALGFKGGAEFDFFVGVVVVGHHRAGEGGDLAEAFGRRGLAENPLLVGVAAPGFVAVVLDFLFEGEVVGTALEGVGFIDGDAVFLPAERYGEGVLSVGEGVAVGGAAEGVKVARRFAVAGGQPALQEEAARVFGVEQGERFAAVFGFGVGGQVGADDGAALAGDVEFKDVGFDVDDCAVISGSRVVAGDVAAATATGCGYVGTVVAAGRNIGRSGNAGAGWRRCGWQVGNLPFLPEQEGDEGGRDVQKQFRVVFHASPGRFRERDRSRPCTRGHIVICATRSGWNRAARRVFRWLLRRSVSRSARSGIVAR